ncbi:hypothetical protein D3C81_1636140 [compost metagenome]
MRQQDHFLLQALRVEFGLHVGEAVENLLALGGEHLWHQGAQSGDFAGHAVQAFVDQAGQFATFAIATALQFIQRLDKQRHGFVVEGLWVVSVGYQYSGPGQHFQRVERGWLLDQAGNGLGSGHQLCGALTVYLQRLAGAFFVEAQGAFDLAA